MTVTVAEATATQTQEQILTAMYAYADSIGVDIVGVQTEAMFRALYELESTALLAQVDIRVAVALSGFLDTSTGSWLTLLAFGIYNLTRAPATKAIRSMDIAGGAAASADAKSPGSVLVQTIDGTGIQYRNLTGFTIKPGGTVHGILWEAVLPGTQANLPKGTTFDFVTTQGAVHKPIDQGFGTLGTRPAVDVESDPLLRARCRAQWPALALWGTRLAFAKIIQEAFDAAGLANTITRFALDDTNPSGPGSYDLYLGNSTGGATLTELATVVAYFATMEVAGFGLVRVFSAVALNIPVTVILYGSANTGKATSLINGIASATKIAGKVYVSEIIGALGPAPGGASAVLPGLYSVALTTPTADVQLAFNQLPVFTPLSVTSAP